jgi:hypothetical protein
MLQVKQLFALVAFILGITSAYAACPSSVTVGSPDSPVEIADALQGDPAFAGTHLKNVRNLLPRVRESCQKGVASNCRLADFLAKAQSGLECYAGMDGSTAGQMHSGSAREMTNGGAAGAGKGNAAVTAGGCQCGPDYVQCWARRAQSSGSRYRISPDGRGITFYDSKGLVASVKGIDADGSCSAITK